MHRAKENGRNNAQYFTLGMEVEAKQRRELEKMLRQAIDDQQFTLNYQPIVDTTTGKIKSAEALIRWTHPIKGVISPANFIPFAEEKGLILPIGEWVLNEACKTAASWQDHSDHPPSVSVNLSSYQLQRQNIPQLLQNVLAISGLPAEKLTLEITESLLLSDDEETLRQLQGIRQLGVKLSIDDFGTGYSSLSYLKKFPISNLKIDRSFIMGLPASSEDAALVKAIVLMGESLNLNVIAEGIETQQQADFLKSLNCKWVQGFLYSKPLSKTDFLNFLKVH
ncbi:Sensory box/GGDEF family protein [gamma proteobacterium IMCC2047]|nr:Sensory box/GGDEF family protein [gamma proteobacterium IMCC2047]